MAWPLLVLDHNARHCARCWCRQRGFHHGAFGSSARAENVSNDSWGEPDLQGIWTDESDTPLQRSPKFANQETFTTRSARIGSGAFGADAPRQAGRAWHRARCRRRLQCGVHLPKRTARAPR